VPAVAEAPRAIDELPAPVDLEAADRDRDLFGIVTDEEGHAIAGARVESLFHDGRRLSLNDPVGFWQVRAGPSSRSAVDGTFLLRLERGEAVELVITHPGFARCALAQRQAGELVEAVLVPASRLEVLARDAEGGPVSSVRLRLWRHDHARPGGSAFCERDGGTDAGGRFVFEDRDRSTWATSFSPRRGASWSSRRAARREDGGEERLQVHRRTSPPPRLTDGRSLGETDGALRGPSPRAEPEGGPMAAEFPQAMNRVGGGR
jgi:hypothetical protein